MLLALIGASLSLGGCGKNVSSLAWVDPTVTLTREAAPSLTNHDLIKQTFRSVSANPYGAMPSKGNANVLVVPVEFDNYKFDEKTLTDINTLFNGTDEDTGYWKSVSSFYKESSFEQLSINATVGEVYSMDMAPSAFMKIPDSDGKSVDYTSSVVALVRKVVDAYKTDHGADSTKAFDADADGVIDGVYLIYSFYDYQTAAENSISANNTYWAFTARDTVAKNVDSPSASNFVWASYDFMYAGVKKGTGVDAHTYVHETGHMLGLDDYYNYDDIDSNENVAEKYRYYSPTGALDMMDYNILDHDCYSKFALGWTSPYVATPTLDFPVTVTLQDSVSSNGDFIIIPDYTSSYNGTSFGEYMMLELYAPTGLNALDTASSYRSSRPRGFLSAGVKITHVDARIGKYNGGVFTYDETPTAAEFAASTASGYYNTVASNTPSRSGEKEGYRLIHLLESSGTLTFDNLTAKKNGYSYANDTTLFTAADGHNRFSMKKFSSFFENGTKFNNEHDFGYSIRVNGVKKDGDGVYKASITINRAS